MAGRLPTTTPRTHLYRLRRAANLERRAAATQAGCSYTHYCDIERGWSRPSEDLIDRLATLFRIDPLELERTLPPARPRTNTPRERADVTT